MDFTYYHGREAELTAFYRLPKFLFDTEFIAHLGDRKNLLKSKEIVYYAILLDKLELSYKNNWINDNNRVFVRFKDETASKILQCSLSTITKIKKNLHELGLISWQNLGKRKANLIYINKIGCGSSIDLLKGSFKKLHKFLFDWEELSDLSTCAKVLFCLMMDELNFSKQKGLIGESGNEYIMFSRDRIMDLLSIGKNTASKITKELEDIGLIRVEQGFVGDNRQIYLQIPYELLHRGVIQTPVNTQEVKLTDDEDSSEFTCPNFTCHHAQKLRVIGPNSTGHTPKNYVPHAQNLGVTRPNSTGHMPNYAPHAQISGVTRPNSTCHHAQNLGTNKTIINKTSSNNTNQTNHLHQNNETMMTLDELKEKYGYENLVKRFDLETGKFYQDAQATQVADLVINSILNTLNQSSENISVGKIIISRKKFTDRVLNAAHEDISELCMVIDAHSGSINNIDSYIKAVIWDILDKREFNDELGEKLRRKEITLEEFNKLYKP